MVCGAAVMPDQLVRHVGWHRKPSVSVRSVVTEEWFVPQGRAVPVLSPAVSNLPVREADGSDERCGCTAKDGRRVYCPPHFMESLTGPDAPEAP